MMSSPDGDRHAAPVAELLIDCEEDGTLRALLVGMLRERAESLLIRRRPQDHARKGPKASPRAARAGVLRPRVACMGRREHDIYEHAVHAVIAQAAKEIERVRRERDIDEHAVHAVIAQAATE